MRTIFVLDTSVLIYDPCAYKQFKNSDVILPIAVLGELDKLKKQSAEVGRNARVAIRMLDEICTKGDISTGILLDDDILLKIDATYIDCNEQFPGLGPDDYPDTHILACALLTKQERPGCDVCLVSNDINLRVKAMARGVRAQAYEDKQKNINDLYSGMQTIINEDAGMELLERGQIDPTDYELVFSPNECVIFQSSDNMEISLGRMIDEKIKVIKGNVRPWGLTMRNNEQLFLAEMILDPSVHLVSAIGPAGTGKTLVAIASAIELVLSKKTYEKLIIYKSIQPVGNDIGYTPGTIAEKLAPWFQAIVDNFEFLFGSKSGSDWRSTLELYQRKNKICFEAITYIRGRSIANSIILVEESQNLTASDLKSLCTRVAAGSKIILCGDRDQIDSPHLDSMDNEK